jgi:hypothetical protein
MEFFIISNKRIATQSVRYQSRIFIRSIVVD